MSSSRSKRPRKALDGDSSDSKGGECPLCNEYFEDLIELESHASECGTNSREPTKWQERPRAARKRKVAVPMTMTTTTRSGVTKHSKIGQAAGAENSTTERTAKVTMSEHEREKLLLEAKRLFRHFLQTGTGS